MAPPLVYTSFKPDARGVCLKMIWLGRVRCCGQALEHPIQQHHEGEQQDICVLIGTTINLETSCLSTGQLINNEAQQDPYSSVGR
jgi:hypothetical protein